MLISAGKCTFLVDGLAQFVFLNWFDEFVSAFLQLLEISIPRMLRNFMNPLVRSILLQLE